MKFADKYPEALSLPDDERKLWAVERPDLDTAEETRSRPRGWPACMTLCMAERGRVWPCAHCGEKTPFYFDVDIGLTLYACSDECARRARMLVEK